MHSGSCLCGAVQIKISQPLPPPNACHCTSCRKQTGHYEVSADVAKEAVRIEGEVHVRWYHSSKKVRRGFCAICGSTLFWDPIHHDWMGVAMGLFETPTHTSIARHIFVAEKGDYYEITDDLPQNEY